MNSYDVTIDRLELQLSHTCLFPFYFNNDYYCLTFKGVTPYFQLTELRGQLSSEQEKNGALEDEIAKLREQLQQMEDKVRK